MGSVPLWAKDLGHGQSAQERASEVPPGPWQGNWRVTRDDPRIRTLAGSELARLHVMQDRGSRQVEVQWVAGRAMCEDPNAPPCEWASANGEVKNAQQEPRGGLRVVLPVSADPDDPFTLRFPRPPQGEEVVQGTLQSARGDYRWRIEIQRLPD